jgi:ubiquinone/menaquinone biosynthesis C-methylase UbiE
MIEHVPDPERALCEMARVTRQGGIVVVKAPHHRNPLLPLADLLCLRARYPLTRRWHENVPRLAEVVLEFWRKARSPHAQFRTRDPDLSDVVQVGEDADAVYEVCVFDLIAFFREHGFSILNVAAPRRHKPSSQLYTRLFPYFASVGIVAQKSAPRA